MKRLGIIVGFLYGTVLLVLAAAAAGFGHGLYAPLGLVSSPFSLLGIRAAFVATPLLWALVGFVAYRNGSRGRRAAVWLLVAHYCAAAIVLLSRDSAFADFNYWAQLPHSIKVLS